MTPSIDQAERLGIISGRINRGQDSYAGRLDAWHLLGNVSGEFQRFRDMLAPGGADFEVFKDQLEYAGKMVQAFATFRVNRADLIERGLRMSDIDLPGVRAEIKKIARMLGFVGKDYQVIPHEAGMETMDALVGSIDGAHYETMGTLDYGATVWAQVDPNVSIHVGDDVSKVFLTFHTSHDGSRAFEIFENMVREVCKNTVRIGYLNRLAAMFRLKHTRGAVARLEGIQNEVAEIRKLAETMQDRLNLLACKNVTQESMTAILDRLFPKAIKADGVLGEDSTRRTNILADVLRLYESNDGDAFPEQRGTAYNLLNAITNYTDHERSTRGNGATGDASILAAAVARNRAESASFGSGAKLKSDAFNAIWELAPGMPDKLRGMRGIGQDVVQDMLLVPRVA